MRATNQIHLVSKRNVNYRELILKLYIVFGILTVFLGLFYEQIILMVKNNPEQFMLVIVGTLMIAVSRLWRWWYFKE